MEQITVTQLEEKLDRDYQSHLTRHSKILKEYQEAKLLLQQLPKYLTDKKWYQFIKVDEKTWYLETLGLSKEEAIEFKESLPYYWVPKYRSFNNSWQYKATVKRGDITIRIVVDGGDKPANCRVIEIKEVKEVITYKSICEDIETSN